MSLGNGLTKNYLKKQIQFIEFNFHTVWKYQNFPATQILRGIYVI